MDFMVRLRKMLWPIFPWIIQCSYSRKMNFKAIFYEHAVGPVTEIKTGRGVENSSPKSLEKSDFLWEKVCTYTPLR